MPTYKAPLRDMNFLINDPESYKSHKNPEGAFVPANREWHERNGIVCHFKRRSSRTAQSLG